MQRIAKQRKKIDDEKITKDLKAKRDPKGIAQEIVATAQAEPPPHRARYVVNDTSVEKLGEILAANPNGVLLFRDELIGFLRSMDRDGREGDRSFYLEAWNGTADLPMTKSAAARWTSNRAASACSAASSPAHSLAISKAWRAGGLATTG